MSNLTIKKWVGFKIREIRKNKGYSQNDLANLLNVKTNTVSRWENGLYEPGLEHLANLSKLFSISIGLFFPEPYHQTGDYDKKTHLLNLASNVSEKDLQEIIEYTEFKLNKKLKSKQ